MVEIVLTVLRQKESIVVWCQSRGNILPTSDVSCPEQYSRKHPTFCWIHGRSWYNSVRRDTGTHPPCIRTNRTRLLSAAVARYHAGPRNWGISVNPGMTASWAREDRGRGLDEKCRSTQRRVHCGSVSAIAPWTDDNPHRRETACSIGRDASGMHLESGNMFTPHPHQIALPLCMSCG